MSKEKFNVSLWETGSIGYIPIFSMHRSNGNQKKIYSSKELSWHDVFGFGDPVEEVRQSFKECEAVLRQCHEGTISALKAKRNERESIAAIPTLPKTPNFSRKGLRKVKAGKIRTSTQSDRRAMSLQQTVSPTRKSQLILDTLYTYDPDASSHVTLKEASDENESSDQTSKNRLDDSKTMDASDHCSFEIQGQDQPKSSQKAGDSRQVDTTELQKSTSEVTSSNDDLSLKLFISTTEDEFDETRDEMSESMALSFKAPAHSKKTAAKKKGKPRKTRSSVNRFDDTRDELSESMAMLKPPAAKKTGRPRKSRSSINRCIRRTRQAARLSSERQSTAVFIATSECDAPPSNENDAEITDVNQSSPVKEHEKSPVKASPELFSVEEADMEFEEPSSSNRRSRSIVRVSLQRLSSEEIDHHISGEPLPEQLVHEKSVEKQQNDIRLVMTDSSDSFEEEEKITRNKRKSTNRKRKSKAKRATLEKKRKTLRESIEVLTVKETKDISPSSDKSEHEESSPKNTAKAVPLKPSRPKPRIAKPVIRKKDVMAKTTRSSVKRNGRALRTAPASTTPIRTRQRFVSPLLRTPGSSNIHTTIKSFLLKNTPEPANKEAILETKKKLLEEKQRQGEERQRKIEEEKKMKLAEAKRKREERALRAIRIRETKEKEKKEQQDQMHDKWEQRIADVNRTKTQQKLQNIEKITKQFEKIAKAGAKRKEDEEEKIKRILEQNEEKEKRLQQQQAEKKLLEEQRQKEKQLEEQRRMEEEKIKESARLAQLEEEEKARKAEEADLKKKQELEAKRKKHKEKMDKLRKKAELERETLRKKKQEESRLAKEEEKKRKQEERKVKEEKVRQEREQAAAAREEKLRAAREAEREAMLQFENEKMMKRMEAAKKREEMYRQEQAQKEEAAKLREKQKEHLRKVKEAEERINKLQASNAESNLRPQPQLLITKVVLNATFSKDESMNNYDMTPRGPDRPLLPSTANDYNIDDFCSDDSTDDEDRPRKIVPKWAKGALLQSAILRQYNYPWDLNMIFPTASLFNPVYLPSLFVKQKKERYYKRTSSAFWNSPVMPAGHISFTQQSKGF